MMSASRTGNNFAARHDAQGDPAMPIIGPVHETARGGSIACGVSVAIGEVLRRNQTAPASTLAEFFICNVADDHLMSPGEMLGRPRATEHFSVEQLEANGLSGLYRRTVTNGAKVSKVTTGSPCNDVTDVTLSRAGGAAS